MDFDVEKFIHEIKNRPAIWNTKSEEYADKELKLQAWNGLVDEYATDESITREERKRLCIHLQKKWRNIRDCFVKTHKARLTNIGNAGKKTYAFYEQLLFLADDEPATNNVINVHDIKLEVSVNEDEDSLSNLSGIFKRKRKLDPLRIESVVAKKQETQEKEREDDDEARLFFLSLVKEFNKIPEHLRIQTKIDLLNVIKDAQFSD